MFVEQISVFVENKTGRLADVMALLGREGVDVKALTVADTADFGIIRLIVNSPEKALTILKTIPLPQTSQRYLRSPFPTSPAHFTALWRC